MGMDAQTIKPPGRWSPVSVVGGGYVDVVKKGWM